MDKGRDSGKISKDPARLQQELSENLNPDDFEETEESAAKAFGEGHSEMLTGDIGKQVIRTP
ncbi:hypothetical protein GJ688_17320 [Heliobacillus mobilis]|uniref:DUF4025 domain-containing protein n=1 Tax=Heliobacterium mobile TaxID=28064 RepID=A0A6I3SNV8_HELMO|nr:hypothetical protein [Heliobacterium mobile]MTV50698.1 hypothetical protein [Heliobacterium mobile]